MHQYIQNLISFNETIFIFYLKININKNIFSK